MVCSRLGKIISSCCDFVRSDGVRSGEPRENIASKPRREETASVADITTVRHPATERRQTDVLLRSDVADGARRYEIQATNRVTAGCELTAS